MIVTAHDVAAVFPRELNDEETQRVEALIEQSLDLVGLEFARRGRDFAAEVQHTSWLAVAVKHAVRMMVSRAVLIGDSVGMQSASSTTGPQSDSVTWSQGVGIHWGGVGIDDAVLELLGLAGAPVPLGRGGVVIPFGERGRVLAAEFAERRAEP